MTSVSFLVGSAFLFMVVGAFLMVCFEMLVNAVQRHQLHKQEEYLAELQREDEELTLPTDESEGLYCIGPAADVTPCQRCGTMIGASDTYCLPCHHIIKG